MPEAAQALAARSGVELCTGTADIVELAARPGRDADLRTVAASRGQLLPAFGRAIAGGNRLALSVRPHRWLLLQAADDGRDPAGEWAAACGAAGTAVDLSSALALLLLRGPMSAQLLGRYCRLDLGSERFGAGSAAASVMAQVPIMIVPRALGLLLATPASTARHFREWLVAAGGPFGMGPPRGVTTKELLGD